jgi:hypothetical protein
MEPMKNKNHDELDGDQSIFAASRCCDNRAISKTTPFADISKGVTFVLTGMIQPVPGRKICGTITQGCAPAQPWAE